MADKENGKRKAPHSDDVDSSGERGKRPTKTLRLLNDEDEANSNGFQEHEVPGLPESDSENDLREWENNRLGRASNVNYSALKNDLVPGRLIWAPWHVTAFEDEGRKFLAEKNDRRNNEQHDESEQHSNGSDEAEGKKKKCAFVEANNAVICSKRRMFCVWYTTTHSLQALPMFTHRKRGLKAVRPAEQKNRIPVKDNPVDLKWKEPSKSHKAVAKLEGDKDCKMGHYTIIDYTKSYPIELSEFIEPVGRLTDDGIDYVIEQHEQLRGREDRRNTVSGGETGGILRRLGWIKS